jgi:protein O-GlcNAc transferase
MLRCFFILFTCLLFATAANAQTVKKAIPFYKSGLAYRDKGMFMEAIGSFKKAIALDKKYDSAYLELSGIFLKINMADSAITLLKKAVKINPGFTGAHFALGMIYRDYKRISAEAIVHFLNALKLDSTNKVTLYSLAWCNNDKGNYAEAVKYGIKALEVDNNYRPAYNELAHAYRNLKTYQEAIDQFKKNLAISVTDQPLYYSALCYLELKDKAGAEKMYEELKKINPKSAEGLRKKIDAAQ